MVKPNYWNFREFQWRAFNGKVSFTENRKPQPLTWNSGLFYCRKTYTAVCGTNVTRVSGFVGGTPIMKAAINPVLGVSLVKIPRPEYFHRGSAQGVGEGEWAGKKAYAFISVALANRPLRFSFSLSRLASLVRFSKHFPPNSNYSRGGSRGNAPTLWEKRTIVPGTFVVSFHSFLAFLAAIVASTASRSTENNYWSRDRRA